MNYSDFLIPAFITVYGIFEYQKREQRHRERIALLQSGIEPSFTLQKPEIIKLWITGIVSGLLLATILGFLFLRPRIEYGGNTVLLFLPGFFFIIFVILILILLRDIKAYRQHPKSEEGSVL